MIIVISGPSGVGKSTVVSRLLETMEGIDRSISVTTRKLRGDESDGVEYFFTSREDFVKIRDEGKLLEWAEVHGNLYGTSEEFVDGRLGEGRSVLLEIDVQGGMKVKARKPESMLIFIMPPSFEELEERLRGRETDDDEVIRQRLANANRELGYSSKYDYRVVNGDLDECVGEIRDIITSGSGVGR
ncbi:MAG: guanylate kinase [Candidatus Krumholzibacteria bacterium]|nr:guanylate kinase [Candidatus Krumholzibacteria bacterium]